MPSQPADRGDAGSLTGGTTLNAPGLIGAAAGLANPRWTPQLAIAVGVVVAVVVAVAHEYRADRAGQRLLDLLPVRATALRDDHRQDVPAADLVTWHLVLLEAGDGDGLAVDESILTGVSVPVRPGRGYLCTPGHSRSGLGRGPSLERRRW
jgi:cation transport ATPase